MTRGVPGEGGVQEAHGPHEGPDRAPRPAAHHEQEEGRVPVADEQVERKAGEEAAKRATNAKPGDEGRDRCSAAENFAGAVEAVEEQNAELVAAQCPTKTRSSFRASRTGRIPPRSWRWRSRASTRRTRGCWMWT